MAISAVIFLVAYSLVLGAAIFYPMAADYASTTDSNYKAQLAISALLVHQNIWVAALCISMLVFLITILVSHRIAGPMYRFEKTVEALAAGNFAIRTKLRKRDEFHEFAGLLNDLAVSLENRQAEEAYFRYECKQLLGQLAGKTVLQQADKTEQLQPIMDQLMAKFDAPSRELTPNPLIHGKEQQDLSIG